MVIDKMLNTALSLDRDSLLDTITGTPGIDVETVDLLTKIVKSYQYETLVKILKKRKEG